MKNHKRLMRIFFSLILFPHSFCYRAMLILVTYFMKKRLVDLTDSTYPESAPGSYLVVHQWREKWENLYPFLFFSSYKNGWLCIVCSEYGEGDEFWRAKGVKQGEHPYHTFYTHKKSKKHTKAVSKCAEVKHFFSKGSKNF